MCETLFSILIGSCLIASGLALNFNLNKEEKDISSKKKFSRSYE